MIFNVNENIRIKINKNKKLKDAIHDVVSKLDKDEWLTVKDLTKEIKKFNVTISPSILSNILKDWIDNPKNNNIFLPTDVDWLYYDKENDIVFTTIKFKSKPVIGKSRKKIKEEEEKKNEELRKKSILNLKIENDISVIPNEVIENVVSNLDINLLQDIKKHINISILSNKIKPIYEEAWKYMIKYLKSNHVKLKPQWKRHEPNENWVIPKKSDLDIYQPVWYFKYGKSIIDDIDIDNNLLVITYHNEKKRFKLNSVLNNKSIRIDKKYLKKDIDDKNKRILYLYEVECDIPIYHKTRETYGIIDKINKQNIIISISNKKIKIPFRNFLISQNILIDKKYKIDNNIDKNYKRINIDDIKKNDYIKFNKFDDTSKYRYGKIDDVNNEYFTINNIVYYKNEILSCYKKEQEQKKYSIDKTLQPLKIGEKIKSIEELKIGDIIQYHGKKYIYTKTYSKTIEIENPIGKIVQFNSYSVEVDYIDDIDAFKYENGISHFYILISEKDKIYKIQTKKDKEDNKTKEDDKDWKQITISNIKNIDIGDTIKYYNSFKREYEIVKIDDKYSTQFRLSNGQLIYYTSLYNYTTNWVKIKHKNNNNDDKILDKWEKINDLNVLEKNDKVKLIHKYNRKNVSYLTIDDKTSMYVTAKKIDGTIIYLNLDIYDIYIEKKTSSNYNVDEVKSLGKKIENGLLNKILWELVKDIKDVKKNDIIKINYYSIAKYIGKVNDIKHNFFYIKFNVDGKKETMAIHDRDIKQNKVFKKIWEKVDDISELKLNDKIQILNKHLIKIAKINSINNNNVIAVTNDTEIINLTILLKNNKNIYILKKIQNKNFETKKNSNDNGWLKITKIENIKIGYKIKFNYITGIVKSIDGNYVSYENIKDKSIGHASLYVLLSSGMYKKNTTEKTKINKYKGFKIEQIKDISDIKKGDKLVYINNNSKYITYINAMNKDVIVRTDIYATIIHSKWDYIKDKLWKIKDNKLITNIYKLKKGLKFKYHKEKCNVVNISYSKQYITLQCKSMTVSHNFQFLNIYKL